MAAKRSNPDGRNSSKVLKKKTKIDHTSTRSTETRMMLKPKSEINEKLVTKKTGNETGLQNLSLVKTQNPKISSTPTRYSKRLNPDGGKTSEVLYKKPKMEFKENLLGKGTENKRVSKKSSLINVNNLKPSLAVTRSSKCNGGNKSEVLDKKPKMEFKENLNVKKSFPELADFPDEILLKIICHLSTKDIFKNVSLISKKMNNLTKDSSVPICVNFGHSETSENCAIKIISERAKQVSTLKLFFNNISILKMTMDKISQMRNLNTLNIHDCTHGQPTPVFPKQFVEALTQLKKLTSVDLEGQFEESSFTKVGELNHLKQFHLGLYNYNLMEQELKSLAELKDVPSLFLKLSHPHVLVHNIEMQDLLDNTNRKKKLNHLMFDPSKIEEVEKVLSYFTDVDVLDVMGGFDVYFKLNEEIISNLKSLFSKCKSLRNILVSCDKTE